LDYRLPSNTIQLLSGGFKVSVVAKYYVDQNGTSVTRRILFELNLVLLVLIMTLLLCLLSGVTIIMGILSSISSWTFPSRDILMEGFSGCILFLIFSFALYIFNDQSGPLKSMGISKTTFFRLYLLHQVIIGEKRPLLLKIKTLFLINTIRHSFKNMKRNLEDVYVAIDYEDDIQVIDMVIDSLSKMRSQVFAVEHRDVRTEFVKVLLEFYGIKIKKQYFGISANSIMEFEKEILLSRNHLKELMNTIHDIQLPQFRNFDYLSFLNKKWFAILSALGFIIIFRLIGYVGKEFWAATLLTLFYGVISWVLSIRNNK
jgi:hypothetical protein